MRTSLDETFVQIYKPLLEKFQEEIQGVNTDSLPFPFLPYYGTGYECSAHKIAFVGWETRDNVNLTQYINAYNDNSDEVYYWFRDDLDEPFDFLKSGYGYMNNTGKDFWGFILQFLSKFYGINDWKEIKKNKHPEILKSFVWGNVCSVERYEAANRNGAKIEDYRSVKTASKIFDKFDLLLNIFEPQIVIILNWTVPEEWILNGISKHSEPYKIEEKFIWHYYNEVTNTHIYKTHHPISLARRKINLDDLIFKILQDFKSRTMLKSLPFDKLAEKYNQRPVLFNTLKMQLTKSADYLNLKTFDEEWGNGRESYFYFYLPNSRFDATICFGFEKDYDDFTIGVEVGVQDNNYSLLKEEISGKLSPVIGKDSNYPNWAYLHYCKDDLKRWNLNNSIWDGVENNQTCSRLIQIIKSMILELSTVQL